MELIGHSIFKDKRSVILWLRWLMIIGLSYLLLFHTGQPELSWQISSIILLYILSNLLLIVLPARFFEKPWFDMPLIVADSLIITAALLLTKLSSSYLLLFYFLIILLTTLGKGSGAVVANGLVMVGVYLIFLFQSEGKNLLEHSGLLLQIPFLIISTVFYAVLVDQEHRKKRLFLEQIKADAALQEALRTEIQAKEQALKKAEELSMALRHQALHDSLTQLPNRALLMDWLQHALLLAKRENKRLALIMMDLDGFKEVNDALGHQAGDLLLQQLAVRLGKAVRESDTIARIGGDEFGMVFFSVTDVSSVIMLAQRILTVLEEPFLINEQSLQIGMSMGIALFPEDGRDADNLMRQADAAMYKAKRTKSGFAFYDAQQDQHSFDRLKLLGELRQAIKREELVLYYQPKVDFSTARISGVEALVRWQHPQHGLIFPDTFIRLAEQGGLIKPLTSWVRNTALGQCKAWHQEGLNLTVAINISASSLHDPAFWQRLAIMLETYGVMPAWLELEVTESAVMVKPSQSIEAIARLCAVGVQVSIDDFGTGYSSLAYLAKLRGASIKIDKSFVMHMGEDCDSALIVRSTIDLAHSLGRKVIAEGVETQQIWDLLAHLGCDMGQGYLMGRPMPVQELEKWLGESPWGLVLGKQDGEILASESL